MQCVIILGIGLQIPILVVAIQEGSRMILITNSVVNSFENDIEISIYFSFHTLTTLE